MHIFGNEPFVKQSIVQDQIMPEQVKLKGMIYS